MSRRLRRPPSLAAEALRFLVVLFGAGLGYQLARLAGADDQTQILGVFTGVWVGAIVGAGLGYSLGGVLVRGLLSAFDRGELALDRLSPEQAVAGGIGSVIGALLLTLLGWPVFLVLAPSLAVPLFLFLVVAGAMFGFQAGQRRRAAVLDLVGPRTGLATDSALSPRVPRVVDTSAAIDGRMLDVVRAGFLGGRLLVPAPVLGELQGLADSSDVHRRAKGRRGLDILEALRREAGVEVEVIDDTAPGVPEVDGKLIRICLDRPAALLTLDTNLAKVAALAGVRVLNLYQLALALRPPVVVGDLVTVALSKPGKEAGQAVGYLDDGTMIVVDGARERIGAEVAVAVTSVLTTANGRLVFARLASERSR